MVYVCVHVEEVLGHIKLVEGSGKKEPTITENPHMPGTVAGTFIDSVSLSPYNDPESHILQYLSPLNISLPNSKAYPLSTILIYTGNL